MTTARTIAEQTQELAQMIRCPHDNRTGGNDYLLCNDCGLPWDYRHWSDVLAGARDMTAQLVTAALTAARAEALEQEYRELIAEACPHCAVGVAIDADNPRQWLHWVGKGSEACHAQWLRLRLRARAQEGRSNG